MTTSMMILLLQLCHILIANRSNCDLRRSRRFRLEHIIVNLRNDPSTVTILLGCPRTLRCLLVREMLLNSLDIMIDAKVGNEVGHHFCFLLSNVRLLPRSRFQRWRSELVLVLFIKLSHVFITNGADCDFGRRSLFHNIVEYLGDDPLSILILLRVPSTFGFFLLLKMLLCVNDILINTEIRNKVRLFLFDFRSNEGIVPRSLTISRRSEIQFHSLC